MRTKKGFTLAELVAVTTMIGILVAVATPTMLNSGDEVSDTSAQISLQIVRDALEDYASQNAGRYPDVSDDAAFKAAIDPCLPGVLPASPVGSRDNTVTVISAQPLVADNTSGWMYSSTTGQFILNCTALSQSGSATYDEF